MNAGQLKHRVALQSQVETRDDIGQPSTAWIGVATVWASIRYLSGASAIKAGADTNINSVSIRIRHRAVNAGQRVVFGNETFNIQAVLPDTGRVFVDLVCEAVNADS